MIQRVCGWNTVRSASPADNNPGGASRSSSTPGGSSMPSSTCVPPLNNSLDMANMGLPFYLAPMRLCGTVLRGTPDTIAAKLCGSPMRAASLSRHCRRAFAIVKVQRNSLRSCANEALTLPAELQAAASKDQCLGA